MVVGIERQRPVVAAIPTPKRTLLPPIPIAVVPKATALADVSSYSRRQAVKVVIRIHPVSIHTVIQTRYISIGSVPWSLSVKVLQPTRSRSCCGYGREPATIVVRPALRHAGPLTRATQRSGRRVEDAVQNRKRGQCGRDLLLAVGSRIQIRLRLRSGTRKTRRERLFVSRLIVCVADAIAILSAQVRSTLILKLQTAHRIVGDKQPSVDEGRTASHRCGRLSPDDVGGSRFGGLIVGICYCWSDAVIVGRTQ